MKETAKERIVVFSVKERDEIIENINTSLQFGWVVKSIAMSSESECTWVTVVLQDRGL